MSTIIWHCPECGFIIADCVKEQSRVDLQCPSCGTKRFSEFDIGLPDQRFLEPPDPADWWKKAGE